jgi:SAM-dependent methyltransferase
LIDQRQAWDRFWSYDRLSSFGTGRGAGNYGEPIAAGWREFFASLPEGAHVLDIASGNGAIAMMAVEAGDGLQVTGTDLARVEPAAFVSRGKDKLERIRFLANTPAEALPLDDGSFDAVTSQYGVEYSDMARSVPEAVRVLAPGGRLRFACHAAEGSVAADTKRAVADADFLLDHVDLIGRARDCFTAILGVERGLARSPFATTEAQGKYTAFRKGLQAVAERAQSATDAAMLVSVHRSLTDLFQQRQSHDDAALTTKLDDLQVEVEAHRERERALIAAAQSAQQMAALAERLGSLGLIDVALDHQRDSDDLIGHVVEARRA